MAGMIDTEKYRLLLEEITPKYIGEVFLIDECPIALVGEDVKRYLRGCKSILICVATLGEEFDRLLRQIQLKDMAGAVILDSLAGEYLEEFCVKKDSEIIQNRCYRFSPGYGDFPLNINRDIINALNASTRIGLCVTDNYILTPQKSITGITGVT